MTISDIKPNANFFPFADTIQLLNGNGGTLAVFCYCDEATAESYAAWGVKGPGWYDYEEYSAWQWDSDIYPKNDYPIPFGTMFVVQSAYENVALIYAGEVLPADKEFTITPGVWNMLGNVQPTDLKIKDIVPNANFFPFADTIQLLNGNGGTLAVFCYCDEATAESYAAWGVKGPGWYDYEEYSAWQWDSDIYPKNDYPIPAGLGFVVQSAYEGAGIIIPTPLPVQAK